MTTVLIPLSGARGSGISFIVDEEDAARVAAIRWNLHTAPRSLTRYARSCVNGENVLLHRFILNAASGEIVDHIDGDGLNNSKANLRKVSQRENVRSGIARRAFDKWEAQL